MNKRKRVQEKSELTMNQVDLKLATLGKLQRLVEQIEGNAEEKIKAAKEEAKKDLKLPKKQIAEIEKEIKAFVEANVELFKVQRTKKMNHGVIGLRKSPGALKLLPEWNWGKVIKTAKSMRATKNYVIEKLQLNKSQLLTDLRNKMISPNLAAKIGVSLNDRDEVVIEVMREKIKTFANAA